LLLSYLGVSRGLVVVALVEKKKKSWKFCYITIELRE